MIYVVYFYSNHYELKMALKAFKKESDAIEWKNSRKEAAEYLDGHLEIEQLGVFDNEERTKSNKDIK